MYDILIIGAGVNGAAAARELSRYQLDIIVLERCMDVCEGTSKANSGIAHAGYDAMPGTLKARLNVRGSERMEDLSKELGFFYRRCGSMVLCFDRDSLDRLEDLRIRGEKNGVKGIRIIDKEEALAMEPNISKDVVAALYAPTGAIVDPFGMNIAMAENAADNGVGFRFGTEVTSIERIEKGYRVYVKKHPSKALEASAKLPGTRHIYEENTDHYDAAMVINAAGVYADRIHNMISDDRIGIRARRGEYMLLDTTAGNFVNRTIFQLPGKYGKGILVTPTVHGNLLVGPTAEDIEDKENTETTAEGYAAIKQKALQSVPELPLREVITSFSGLRAKLELPDTGDFMIRELPEAPGFIDMAGMESPGLTCAPAAGEYVAELVGKIRPLTEKKDFVATRSMIPNMAISDEADRKKMIEEDPRFSNVICRCCTVSEGEITNAIHRTLGATTTDGIKRRTGAGMGRCQSGFCNPRVVEILSRELHIAPEEICKNDTGSEYLIKEDRV